MELAFASLHQLCAPLLDRLERLPGPQRDALRIVFGLTRGARAGPLPGRPRGAQPGVRGGRAAPAAVRRRRRAVARSELGADARVRRPPAAGRAGRARVRGAGARRGAPAPAGARGARPRQRRRPRAAELGGALRAGRAGARPDHRRDAGQPARAARAAARADARRSWPAASACRRRATSRSGSRRATSGGSRSLPEDARRLLLVAAAEPVGDPLLLQRACERLGIALAAVDATRRAAGGRGARDLPPSRWRARPCTGPPTRPGAPGGPPGAGGGDRSRRRSGPPRVAPGRRGRRARRGGRARAGALGGPGAGARRPRGRGRVPAARGRADRRPRAAGRPGARGRRRPAWAPGRSTSARGLLAAAEAGPLDELGRARVDLLQAEVAFAQNRGGDAPLLLLQAATTARAARRTPRARHVSRRVGRRAVRRPAGAPAAACSTSPAPWRPRPRPAGPPLPCDLLLDGLALVFTDGRAAAAPVLRRAVAAFAGSRGLRGGDAPVGLAGDAGGELPLGLRPLPRDRHARGAARPRLRGARGPRRRGQRVRPGRRVRRRLRERRAADRGGRRRQGGDRDPHPPARRDRRSPGSAAARPRPPS